MKSVATVERNQTLSLLWLTHSTLDCLTPACPVEGMVLSRARRLRVVRKRRPATLNADDAAPVSLRAPPGDALHRGARLVRPGLSIESHVARADAAETLRSHHSFNADVTVVCAKDHGAGNAWQADYFTESAMSAARGPVLVLRCMPLAAQPHVVVVLTTPKRLVTAIDLLERLNLDELGTVYFAAFQPPSQARMGVSDREHLATPAVAHAKDLAWQAAIAEASARLPGKQVEVIVRDEPLKDELGNLVKDTAAGLVVFGDHSLRSAPEADTPSPHEIIELAGCSVLVARKQEWALN